MYTLVIYLLTIYLIVGAVQFYYGIYKKIRNFIKVRKTGAATAVPDTVERKVGDE